VLIVSTDPAHSLRDALGPRVPARLRAVELNAPRTFARWIARNRRAASDALEHGTWLDRDDIAAVLELPLPGIDELVGLIEIDRLAHAAPHAGRAAERTRERTLAYDIVVIDTAPTGHTLRLLTAPHIVTIVADLLDRLQDEHRAIRARLARIRRPETADLLIADVARQAAQVASHLRSRMQTCFHWVTLPEAMSIAETADALEALGRDRIHVPEIIVNQVLTDEGPCPVCDRRRLEQAEILREIGRTLGARRRVTIVPAQSAEPKGAKGLDAIATSLVRTGALATTLSRPAGRRRRHAANSLPPGVKTLTDPASLDAVRDARLIFVGGKGGVGKTTVAAALALSVARARPGERVLLLSTDPAHSLLDVFQGRVPSILSVVEIDAIAAFKARLKTFERLFDELTGLAGRAADLMELAPPGIDELFGMLTVFTARQQYDRIVVDTAPTGHALRLLETPDVALNWVHVLMRLLLKYREVVHAPEFASQLIDLAKGIGDLQTLFSDHRATRFLVVTRAAALPRLESARLLARLRRLRFATPAIIVNGMTLAPGRCRRCCRTAETERIELQALRRVAGHRGIIRTPLAAPAPRGLSAIDRWRRLWIAD